MPTIAAGTNPASCRIIAPQKIEWKDLQTFHSQAFIDFIRTYGNIDADELSPAQLEEADMYGLSEYTHTFI